MGFGVLRNQEKIADVHLPDAVDANIQFNASFGEWSAATSLNLDLWKWDNAGYPKWFMAKVLAFYNLTSLVKAHTEQARIDKEKRMAKRGRGRR